MIEPLIAERLAAIEATHDVRILLAVESGSHACGYASPGSDYDVRFIYAHPMDWYFAVDLEERRDVLEFPIEGDIDLHGWDVRKALRLLWRSNPTAVEWLQSPIVYQEAGSFAASARALLPRIYSLNRGFYHHRKIAKNDFRTHLRASPLQHKKYFYVLRSLLTVLWLERHAAPPPLALPQLLSLLDPRSEALAAIEHLLAARQITPDLGMGPPIPAIHAFIAAELARLEAHAPVEQTLDASADELNALFLAILHEG